MQHLGRLMRMMLTYTFWRIRPLSSPIRPMIIATSPRGAMPKPMMAESFSLDPERRAAPPDPSELRDDCHDSESREKTNGLRSSVLTSARIPRETKNTDEKITIKYSDPLYRSPPLRRVTPASEHGDECPDDGGKPHEFGSHAVEEGKHRGENESDLGVATRELRPVDQRQEPARRRNGLPRR